jgi:hypothetical protein
LAAVPTGRLFDIPSSLPSPSLLSAAVEIRLSRPCLRKPQVKMGCISVNPNSTDLTCNGGVTYRRRQCEYCVTDVLDNHFRGAHKERTKIPEPTITHASWQTLQAHDNASTHCWSTRLLVIMFGRLGMSIDESKVHCSAIVNGTFSEKRLLSTSETFKATKLEAAVKRMLEACGAGADARMRDPRATPKHAK